MEARRQWYVFKTLKVNNNTRNPSMKVFFSNKGEIKTFLEKQKFRGLFTCISTLKGLYYGILQVEKYLNWRCRQEISAMRFKHLGKSK